MTLEKQRQELCVQCQKCCKEMAFQTVYEATQDNIDFFQKRGFRVEVYGYAIYLWTDKLPCPHLTKDGCGIYENRPQVCKDYDGREQFKEDCLWNSLDRLDKETKETQ